MEIKLGKKLNCTKCALRTLRKGILQEKGCKYIDSEHLIRYKLHIITT